MDERTDEQLVIACSRGDREAFAALVRRHTWRVYATCYGVVGDVADSEDLTQETFVKGMARIDTVRDGSSFGGWIVQIARNLSRDFLRTRSRQRRILEEHTREEEATETVSEYMDLHEALARLPEKDRLPLVLYYLDGQSTEHLAEELGISPAGAHTRLSRARNELRKLLGEGGDVS